MRALLALEDGSLFPGRALGATRSSGGEVVFNTSMTGYQEILTDPSYHGQIVVFTAPQLGNYGIHPGEGESYSLRAAGVIAREICTAPSHPRSEQSLPAYLKEQNCFGLTEVDTRALTLLLRRKGSLRGWLTTEVTDPQDAVQCAREVPPMDQVRAVPAVTTPRAYVWEDAASGAAEAAVGGARGSNAAVSLPAGAPMAGEDGPRVVVLDCGVKYNILRELSRRGCRVAVLPAESEAAEIERLAPDGIVLSNGPGDPTALRQWLPRVSRLMEKHPTLAICLGHQLAGLALGCRIVKLPFGHHGGNHPVKDLRNNRVLITAQNHNYAIDPTSLPADFQVTHLNLNDGTVEGMAHRTLPLWSVQYHPEAGPGPHEAAATFDDFTSTLHQGSRPSVLHAEPRLRPTEPND